MDIHDEITPEYILEHEDVIAGSPLVLSDGNIPIQSISKFSLKGLLTYFLINPPFTKSNGTLLIDVFLFMNSLFSNAV